MTRAAQVFVEYRLRPAATADTRFLFTLLHATRQDAIVETWGGNEAWQRRNFDARVEQHVVSIIEVDRRPAGSLWLGKQSDVLYLADLQILPELQGLGIGTAVVRGLIAQAETLGVPVGLVVQQTNARARRLYERLGFKVTSVEAPGIHMRHE
jgi:ribosomal protein S18 acetylase RimI-like enzyme